MKFKKLIGRLKTRIWGAVRKRFSKKSQKKLPRNRVLEPKFLPPNELEAIDSEIAPESNSSAKALQAIDEFSGVQLSLHTQRAYKKDLEDFFAFLRTQNIWNDWSSKVTPILVSQYRMHLIRTRQLSKGSVTRKLAVLKSFYKWSLSRGWVSENPAELVKSFPQTQDSKTGFLSDVEIDKLLSSRKGAMADWGLTQALNQVVIESLLMLAVRRSEAAQMRVGDLEFLEGKWTIRIHGKGDRERVLPLAPRLVLTWSDWLRRIGSDTPAAALDEDAAGWVEWSRRHSHQPLLISTRARNYETPLSASEIARIVRKSARKAGVINRVSPHMLRATAITHALDQGASHRGVQQMAGWTSPLMISRYDKRRKDPRFSAVLNLKYAQRPNPQPVPFQETSKESNVSPA